MIFKFLKDLVFLLIIDHSFGTSNARLEKIPRKYKKKRNWIIFRTVNCKYKYLCPVISGVYMNTLYQQVGFVCTGKKVAKW